MKEIEKIANALHKANIPALRDYFLDETNEGIYDRESYQLRINKVSEKWVAFIEKLDPDSSNPELYSMISELLPEYEQVYMEIGIQAGLKLAKDIGIYCNDKESGSKYERMYFTIFDEITMCIDSLQKVQQKAEEMYLSGNVEGQGEGEMR